jgi:hypothetical protein
LTFHPVKTMDEVLALSLARAGFEADAPTVAPN